MKRKVITVNEEKCTGCGNCIPGCPEGALQIIDGKARLVSDLFCDGLGACIGECPTGAMFIEEREAEAYDENKVMENIVKGGENTIKAHLKHLEDHNEKELLNQAKDYLNKNGIKIPDISEKLACGCPGTMTKSIERNINIEANVSNANIISKLTNWPVQLQLLNPNAPYLKNAELVIAADCVPFAYANFHERFLKNKVLTVFCPKLDKTIDGYIDKLADIFKTQEIKSITIVHMEVPCCSGISRVVEEALKKAQKNIIVKDYTISISGEII
jgi:NAD-dependent dihydropyrimidine dehydrogenase PreA subunit